MENGSSNQIRAADIELSGLSIWIHGRQFEDAQDYYDGNWLRVSACCTADMAKVWTKGSIIHLPEIVRWRDESEKMYQTLSGEAGLNCMEPNLKVQTTCARTGHIKLKVEITPDHMTQKHEFQMEIDQSYLPELIAGCNKVLALYPIRGKP